MTHLFSLRQKVRERNALPPSHVRRALRVSAGVSLEDLAAALNVSRETVRLWELGLAKPRAEHLPRYLNVLDLLRLEGDRGCVD